MYGDDVEVDYRGYEVSYSSGGRLLWMWMTQVELDYHGYKAGVFSRGGLSWIQGECL